MPDRAPRRRRFLARLIGRGPAHQCDRSLPTETLAFRFHLDDGDHVFQVEIHRDEEGTWWGHVHELPGCFATGTCISDLFTNARRSVEAYLTSVP